MGIETYKIKLQPLTSFYFGNERTLGPNNADYFAKSNYFPQQTTLLGMLRYRLLEMNGWLKDHTGYSAGASNDIDNLIGSRGFDANNLKQQDFGVIKTLSPVFLEKGDALLVPGALNKGNRLEIETPKDNSKEINIQWAGLNAYSKPHLPRLKGFDYKNPVDSLAIDTSNQKQVEYWNIFKTYDKVGIIKTEGAEPEQKGFFKQDTLTFQAGGFAFIAYVELDEAEGKKLAAFVKNNPHVLMGGERSAFHMHMEKKKLDSDIFKVYLNFSDQDTKRKQIILLSHAKVSNDIYGYCLFAVSQTADFRHIITTTKTSNHYAKPTKSNGYQLLKKGSVLYPSEDGYTQLIDELTKNNEAFRQIGYNAFILIEDGKVTPYIYSYKNDEQNA